MVKKKDEIPFIEIEVDKRRMYSGPAKPSIMDKVRLSSGRFWAKIKNHVKW